MIFNTVAAFGAAAAGIAGVAAAPASTLEKRCTEPSGIKQGKSFDRAFFIFFENEDRSTVINDPTYASFAKKGINHNNYVAVAHPSQPNYVAYVSGSTNGVTGDSNTNIAASSIADRLEAAGISWSIYAENLPSGCYASATATGGYARKHEPFISFNNIRNNSTRCSEHIKPASQFADDVANGNVAQFTAMIPNLNDDGHDTNTSYSGAWLKNFYGQYTDFFTKTNTLLHLVYVSPEACSSLGSSRLLTYIALTGRERIIHQQQRRVQRPARPAGARLQGRLDRLDELQPLLDAQDCREQLGSLCAHQQRLQCHSLRWSCPQQHRVRLDAERVLYKSIALEQRLKSSILFTFVVTIGNCNQLAGSFERRLLFMFSRSTRLWMIAIAHKPEMVRMMQILKVNYATDCFRQAKTHYAEMRAEHLGATTPESEKLAEKRGRLAAISSEASPLCSSCKWKDDRAADSEPW